MSGQQQSDSAIVVGAGVVGIACAHYLSKAGFSVTVIDRGSVAAECSYANCGYICPSHVAPLTEPGAISVALKSLLNPKSPFRVKPTLDLSVWNWMWQFAKRCNHSQVISAGKHLQAILDASMTEYHALIAETGLQCEWQTKGLLYVFRSHQAMEKFAETDRMLTEHFGVVAKRIEGADLPKLDSGLRDDLTGAFHYPKDCFVRPDLLNQQWASYLTERGVQFIENCQLRGIRKQADRIAAIDTSQGSIIADKFVFAMGALSTRWSRELGCSIPIQPGKGYSVTLKRPENCPSYPMLFPEEKVGVSPFSEHMRLGSMMEFAGFDSSIPDYRIQQLRNAARAYLIASVDGPAEETWYGWRPMTWDSLPIIGPIPRLSGAYLATGHNMLGLSLATSTGRLIAEMLSQQPTHIDAGPFSPARFFAR